MSSNLADYLPAKEAAKEIGITYSLLMARRYKGTIVGKKLGWGVFFHKDEVAKAKREQQKKERALNANNKGMERPTG